MVAMELLILFLSCKSPLERSYNALLSNPTQAYEEVSLLAPQAREEVVLELMRVAPQNAAPLCKLLFAGDAKKRCLRMKESPHSDWLELKEDNKSLCKDHPDPDTCWDIRAQRYAREDNREKAVEQCHKLIDVHWQAECLQNLAVERAAEDALEDAYFYCSESTKLMTLDCERKFIESSINLSIREHRGLNKDLKVSSKSRHQSWTKEEERSKQIKMIWKSDTQKGMLMSESFWSGVIWGLGDIDSIYLYNLPKSAIPHRRCWTAHQRVLYNSQPLVDLKRWERELWINLSKDHQRGVPRDQIKMEKSFPTALFDPEHMLQISTFRAFELRPAAPLSPQQDWMLCIMESIARLKNTEQTLLKEITQHSDPILKKRAEELLIEMNNDN